MTRHTVVMLVTLAMLMSLPWAGRAQEASSAPLGTGLAPPVSGSVAITAEVVATVHLPAAAIPPPPAIFDVWLWTLRPDEELTFATGEAPPSIAADVVLAGEYTVRSEGRLQVQRGARLEEVPPGTVATVHPGDAVIYVENQAAQVLRNPGDEEAKAISFGVYSAAPPSAFTSGPVNQEDWRRTGFARQDLMVSVEQLIVPPGASLPAFAPDVQVPRMFAVIEGVVQRARVMPGGVTPGAGATYLPGRVIGFSPLGAGEQLQLRNDGDQPLVLLQVTVSADHVATLVAGKPVS